MEKLQNKKYTPEGRPEIQTKHVGRPKASTSLPSVEELESIMPKGELAREVSA